MHCILGIEKTVGTISNLKRALMHNTVRRNIFFTNDKCRGTSRCAFLKVGAQHWNHQFTFYINSQYIVYFVSVLTLLCFCLEYHSLVYKHILFLRVCSFTCSKHNSFIILAACARQLQKIKQGRNRGLGVVHKVRQHFLGRGEGGVKNWGKIDDG